MPASSEFVVYTRAPRDLVWSVFSKIEGWKDWGSAYGTVRWTQGRPWEKGSHFVTELKYPVEANVEHIILSCSPAEKVNWTVHALGVAIDRLVLFQDTLEGTEIRTSSLITGNPIQDMGGDLGDLLQKFTQRWYQEMADYCERLYQEQIKSAAG